MTIRSKIVTPTSCADANEAYFLSSGPLIIIIIKRTQSSANSKIELSNKKTEISNNTWKKAQLFGNNTNYNKIIVI